ncbi:MAG: MotA/TolQ/ExbB proton channel family protein [Candidatus Latescibacteria bacterium]|nr:MotA/TolQ/ExbB proton channel family protein [Candidatus Latescibacterota bacterium]
MLELIQSGGEVMVILVIMSVVALAVLLERLIVLHRAPSEEQIEQDLEAMEAIVDQQGEAAAAEHCSQGRGFTNYVFGALMKRFDVLVLEERDIDDIRDELAVTTTEMSRKYLGRFLLVLSTIGTVAPLLGLLGTILGMITAFEAIARAGTGDPQVVAGGISTALLTTAGGLIIAIPSIIFYRYLANKAEAVVERGELYFHAFGNTLIKSNPNLKVERG